MSSILIRPRVVSLCEIREQLNRGTVTIGKQINEQDYIVDLLKLKGGCNNIRMTCHKIAMEWGKNTTRGEGVEEEEEEAWVAEFLRNVNQFRIHLEWMSIYLKSRWSLRGLKNILMWHVYWIYSSVGGWCFESNASRSFFLFSCNAE